MTLHLVIVLVISNDSISDFYGKINEYVLVVYGGQLWVTFLGVFNDVRFNQMSAELVKSCYFVN
jgi:hypothetical protein